MLACLLSPGVASAEIRTGTAPDPVGDSAGAPSQDIVSASVQHDKNGQLTVSATVNGDIPTGPKSFISFDVKSYLAPSSCTGSYASLIGFSDSEYNTVLVQGISKTGDGLVGRAGATITFRASGNAFMTRDYSCMTLTVSRPTDQGGGILDQLDTPLWFDGTGPDTDADGVLDNKDQCSSQPGPAPSGCPAPPPVTPGASTPAPGTSTTPKCKPPKLKGKSLSAAKSALKKANCKLGKITKPKKPKKGVKLVVIKQSGAGPVNVTLGPKKRKKA